MSAPSLKILGIYREEKFSNRAIDADRAIMDSVLKVLAQKLGDVASIIVMSPEDNLTKIQNTDCNLIFSMAQDDKILSALDTKESNGVIVLNSSRSIMNCYRHKLSELLCDEAFSYPKFWPLNLDSELDHFHFEEVNSSRGFWVKRGDFHAMVGEDVIHVDSVDKLPAVLTNFSGRGVNTVILQENCEGELFKFYGVKDTYFSLRHMGKTTNDRYVTINGNPHIDFDRNHLEKLVHKAARVLELDFFGGDCIVTDSGKIHFIDFNDWPSFRTCRDEVAPFMATYALNKLNCEA